MPYRLIPPTPGRSPYYRVRGTEFRVHCDRSTQTRDKREAQKFLRAWKEEAQRLALSGSKPEVVTFARAAISYMQAGRDKRFLAPLIEHFGNTPLDWIDQAAIDGAAVTIYPDATPATRNRQAYTPVIAVLHHAGIEKRIRRPKGWLGERRIDWLRPEQAFALLEAAEAVDERLGALLTFLLYCGPRLSEALRLEWADVDLARSTALLRETMNGEAQTVYLPAPVVAALANREGDGRVFRLAKSGRLYLLLDRACARAGVELPRHAAFHILRHTHITWRRLYAGQDVAALREVGLHKSTAMIERYAHIDVSEEMRKADLLPTRAESVR